MHILDHIFMDMAFFHFSWFSACFSTCFSPLRLGNRGGFLLLSVLSSQDPGLLALAGPGAGPSRGDGGPGAA